MLSSEDKTTLINNIKEILVLSYKWKDLSTITEIDTKLLLAVEVSDKELEANCPKCYQGSINCDTGLQEIEEIKCCNSFQILRKHLSIHYLFDFNPELKNIFDDIQNKLARKPIKVKDEVSEVVLPQQEEKPLTYQFFIQHAIELFNSLCGTTSPKKNDKSLSIHHLLDDCKANFSNRDKRFKCRAN